MIDPRLEDRTVLITGANHGIGIATARAFTRQGAKVFITYYRSPSAHSEETLKQMRETASPVRPTPSPRPVSSTDPGEWCRNSFSGRVDDPRVSLFEQVIHASQCVLAPPLRSETVTVLGKARRPVGIAANTPLRRAGRPEDVAVVVVFLASEQADWLTGQLLYVGGGWRMHQ